ncbi:MAG TPA: hypothetical protein VML50_07470 [Anaeromyxobacter sp.]|nr:hypothetical protein [Anaeromyxobacter sp.]
MARHPTPLDHILADAAERVVARVSAAISRRVGDLVKEGLARELAGRRPSRSAGRPRRRREITRWVADVRARRVPTFVIEATGIDTKKKIVARYGEGAAFEKGKPPPRQRAAPLVAARSA